MTLAERLARTAAIRECIAAVHPLMGDDPGPDAFAMLHALQALRDGAQGVVVNPAPIDYLERARHAARTAYEEASAKSVGGPAVVSATGTTSTPLGPLWMRTWRQSWTGKLGTRDAWASEYRLDGEPVTLATLRQAGLAARPKTRNRKSRSAEL